MNKLDYLDYSKICSHNDDDPHCWYCKKFVFSIGCTDGCTEGEDEDIKAEEVSHYLIKAFNAFVELPSHHPNELEDFTKAIHQCQYVLMARYARMSRPDLFPIKNEEGLR